MGRELATWIDEGSASVDLFSVDCARFHPETVKDRKWVKDRTHESYAKTYATVFPHDEALAGRDARTSGVHSALVEMGCVHQARHGFERPGWFVNGHEGDQAPLPYDYYGAYADGLGPWRLDEGEDHLPIPAHAGHVYSDMIEGELAFGWRNSHGIVSDECKAAREGVAIFDQSYFGKFIVNGPDAAEAVQYLCGGDVSSKPDGAITYTPLCNAKGGVEADLTVTTLFPDDVARYSDLNERCTGSDAGAAGAAAYYFAAGGSTATKDLAWIERVLDDGGYNAAVHDVSQTMSVLSIQGPHSRRLLQTIATSDPCTLDDGALPFSSYQNVEIAGVAAHCLRLTFVGELGFELHVLSEHAETILRALWEAGETYSADHGVPVRNAGYMAIDSLSAEKGYRHWHADLTNRDTPMEAAIGFTVLPKLKAEIKFLGSDALHAKRAKGLQRRLICLSIDGTFNAAGTSMPMNGLETIYRNGLPVGYVRSTAYGHTVGRTIAYGYVEVAPGEKSVTMAWLKEGEWGVWNHCQQVPATFHQKSPYDPANEKIKGGLTLTQPCREHSENTH